MCGICGIYEKSHAAISSNTIINMRDVMVSRGPDDAGIYVAPHIGMGHRRLSIIDLSQAGHQPLSNEDSTVWIVFNGEIYNFHGLRDELVLLGHRFRSQTDTEVLVHGYEEWGMAALLDRINGMFAFAIWDNNNQELILARDRLGVKPLFYIENNGKVAFSSDIKSFHMSDQSDLTISYEAIDHFLHSYCIPQEFSIYNKVKKVLPGHYIRFKKHATQDQEYWDLKFNAKETMDEHEICEEIERKLILAVKSRLISDVPIGAFLSGGVDSSLIVALMSRLSNSPVKTFSMGVKEEAYNELKYARMVVERYGTEHHEFIIEPDALGILPEMIWNYGEPFADSSQIPTYYVAKLTREYVTVALTGDGGDESFCGYDKMRTFYYAGLYRKYMPIVLRDKILPFAADLLVNHFGRSGVVSKIKTLSEYGSGDFINRLGLGGIFGFNHKEELYSSEFKQHISANSADLYVKYGRHSDGTDEVDRALYVDIKTSLPDDYLTKVDIATMMNSLEARSPFLDYELMEFAARIPSALKIKHGRQKYLLKKVASKYVPTTAIYRKKWGFGIPIGKWFRNDFNKILKEILLSDKASQRGYFKASYIKTLISEHQDRTQDHTNRLWSLLCLELWHQMFIDKSITRNTILS